MQAAPGLLDCTIDYVVTSAGLMITETTIGSFHQYKNNMAPNYLQMRNTAQNELTLDVFVSILDRKQGGGLANTWLVGDVNTGEIMKFEQGLKI